MKRTLGSSSLLPPSSFQFHPFLFCLLSLLPQAAARAQEKLELWVYCPTNLLVDKNVAELETLWKRAAAAGYTHVMLADSKLARLGDLGDNTRHYMANLERARKILADLKLKVVPCVFPIGYSESILWHDPNLAEGLPVKDQPFVVSKGEARLEPDPAVSFPAKFAFKDDVVKVDAGVATADAGEGNARFTYKMKLPQFRSYRIGVKIKTEDFRGEPRIAALVAGNRDLQYQNLGQKPTQDWKETHVVINTLDNTDVNIYFGIWGSRKGRLQWKDWRIEEVGLLNVLRRPGAPCTVKTADGQPLVEGKDYEPIADPHLGNTPWKGSYENDHEPPVIRTKLPDGAKLRVSYYHAAIIYHGQVAICFAEPKAQNLLKDEAKRVRAAFGAEGYMMSHDEIRTCGWDEACGKGDQTPGKLLAENVRFCTKLLDGATACVWSDMFDPFHNAHDKYYLVRGDWAGSWEGLDKSVVIVNWNFGKRDESLKFFADRGHRQVIAGYYDGDPEAGTKAWLASASKVKGVVGMMYTTWQHKYDELEGFAKAVGGKD